MAATDLRGSAGSGSHSSILRLTGGGGGSDDAPVDDGGRFGSLRWGDEGTIVGTLPLRCCLCGLGDAKGDCGECSGTRGKLDDDGPTLFTGGEKLIGIKIALSG